MKYSWCPLTSQMLLQLDLLGGFDKGQTLGNLTACECEDDFPTWSDHLEESFSDKEVWTVQKV